MGPEWWRTRKSWILKYWMPSLPQSLLARLAFKNPRPQRPETKDGARKMAQDNQVREHFRKFDIHKSMGCDGIHPQVLKKLVDVIVRPLSIILDKSWWLREVSEDCRKTNVTPIFRKRKKADSGNNGVNQPHLNSWESDLGANPGIFFQVLRKKFPGLLYPHRPSGQ